MHCFYIALMYVYIFYVNTYGDFISLEIKAVVISKFIVLSNFKDANVHLFRNF